MPATLDLGPSNTSAWDPAQLGLDHYRSLTDLDDIQEALRLLDQEENRVDGDLDDLLADRESLEGKMEGLDVLRWEFVGRGGGSEGKREGVIYGSRRLRTQA
ncbi:hypothetical protein BC936DRAFT_145721 [Jimgerdemannia flammicorona]|uniref:Uncharacterized protein n=1 Tax=Jimgerdemannia flammicorona TaxID=994334 RepID=A0A433D9E5_9FUNG|nr:hypothetical protein BC936DRAFT_145721 [Jimgerdemannia flammicorona]